MLRIDKILKIKIIIVLTQIYLSVFRSDKHGERLKNFYLKNKVLYKSVQIELDALLIGQSIKNHSKPWKIMTRITCNLFFKNKLLLDDLLLAKKILDGFVQKMETDPKKDQYIVDIAAQAGSLSFYLIKSKLDNFTRKLVNRIEHYGQNDLQGQKYLSANTILETLKY